MTTPKSLDNTSKFPKETCACGFWPCRHYPFEPDNTADNLEDQMWSVSNYMAFVMGETHYPIIEGKFIEGLTPHQYTTKRVEALLTAHINTILSEIADEIKRKKRATETIQGEPFDLSEYGQGINDMADTAIQIVKEKGSDKL